MSAVNFPRNQEETSPTLVYVHLGPAPVRWLLPSALMNASLLGSTCYVISDQAKIIGAARSHGLRVFVYSEGERDSALRRHLAAYRHFRQGFWIEAARRLLALQSFSEYFAGPFVHLESDMLVLDRGALARIPEFTQGVSLGMGGSKSGLASILGISSSEALAALNDRLLALYANNRATNEMLGLATIAQASPDWLRLLPTLPSSASGLAEQGASEWFRESASEHRDYFGGVFDVSAIGTHLFGADPRTRFGRRKVFTPFDFMDMKPEECSYNYRSGRLMIDDGVSETPLLSVHIHSKDIRAFHPNKVNRLIANRVSQSSRGPRDEFTLWGFWRYVVDGLRHRTVAR